MNQSPQVFVIRFNLRNKLEFYSKAELTGCEFGFCWLVRHGLTLLQTKQIALVL
jgi:hypothetical protein